MNVFKSSLTTDGSSLSFSLPISKIDQERRIVSGFATTDAVDKQGDIVTAEASREAFSKFRNNIREMHQPKAVGKLISFKEDRYFDPDAKKFYNGIYVSAYISKGAQDTWEKVLDGTLSGFSIGGKMNKWDDGYDEEVDAKIRIIKDYDLVELSLVDSPANQFANILSVEKVDGVDIIKSITDDIEIENVFWDKDTGLVLLSEEDAVSSPTTGEPMQNIGFVEKSDKDKTDVIKFLVDSAKGINTSKITKEVSPMTDTTEDFVEKSDEVVEEVEVAPEAGAETEKAESADTTDTVIVDVEKAEEASVENQIEKSDEAEAEAEKADSATEEVEVSKSVEVEASAMVADIKDALTSAFSDLAETVKSLHEQVNALNKSINGVSGEVAAAKNEIAAAKEQFDEFGKRVDAVEADTAFRKSGDLGEIVQDQPEMVEKSLWGGRFLKTADLFR
jgi:outer membrane murein-binding lipoprotein Lpp